MNKSKYLPTPKPMVEFDHCRFMSRIKVMESCWIWTGSLDRGGYGKQYVKTDNGSVIYRAHRMSYSLFVGELSLNKVVDHMCKNRSCVNPEHLREVDSVTNVMENSESVTLINKNKTHCIRGHIFNEKNTGFCRKGRFCKICKNDRQRAAYMKTKSKHINSY